MEPGAGMNEQLKLDVKTIICSTISNPITPEVMPDDFGLAGENLDSMAVMTLILALEENLKITFDDDELSVDAFQDVTSLVTMIQTKVDSETV